MQRFLRITRTHPLNYAMVLVSGFAPLAVLVTLREHPGSPAFVLTTVGLLAFWCGPMLPSTFTAVVKRHPLVVLFALAYALTWPMIPLVSVSPLLGFPALFGPALAAIIVSALTDGKLGLRDLLGRLVRRARRGTLVRGRAGFALQAAQVSEVPVVLDRRVRPPRWLARTRASYGRR